MTEWRRDPLGRYAERLYVGDGPTEVVRIGDIELRDPLGTEPDPVPTKRPSSLDVATSTPERRGNWSVAIVVLIVAGAIGIGAFLSNRHSAGAQSTSSNPPRTATQGPPSVDEWATGPGPDAMSKLGTDFTNIGNDDVAGNLTGAEQLCAASLEDLDALSATLPVADSALNSDLENVIAYSRTSLTDCQNADFNDEQTNSNEATHYIHAAEPLVHGNH